MDVIWDPWNKRWMCYFSDGKMSMATSSDPMARPGTWYKWYRNGGHRVAGKCSVRPSDFGFASRLGFNSPGLGGQHDYISNFDSVAGANPSVHFNTYLGKWIMVYHSWTGAVFITASKDTIWWDNPRQVLSSTRGYRAWYPTIIGDQGDRVIGQDARVYYADFAGDSVRDFARRMIRFVRND